MLPAPGESKKHVWFWFEVDSVFQPARWNRLAGSLLLYFLIVACTYFLSVTGDVKNPCFCYLFNLRSYIIMGKNVRRRLKESMGTLDTMFSQKTKKAKKGFRFDIK